MRSQGMDGLKEYMGIGRRGRGAHRRCRDPGHPAGPALGRHHGPAAQAEIRRRLARRAGQHRHEGGARARHHGRQHAGPQCLAPWPNSPSAPSWPRPATSPRGHDALRRGEWRGDLYRADLTGQELSEMTVGLIGYGEVGRRVVKLLKAFGCRILVSDPYVQLSADDLQRRRDPDARSTAFWPSRMWSRCIRASRRRRRR